MSEAYATQPILTQRFDAALAYASRHHHRQLRKGTDVPYVSHLLAVASLTLEMGGSEDEAIGALLHDVVEDGGGLAALQHIETQFGARVAAIVHANSDSVEVERAQWRPRKEAYVASIAAKEAAALRVSLADKLHNARAILFDYRIHGEQLWKRFRAGEGESVRWYYRALADAFEERRADLGPGGRAALDELVRVIDELDRLTSNRKNS